MTLEQRADPDQPQAARAIATSSASDDHPPPAAEARERRRHHALHAAGAGPHGRGPRQPHAVPVHARGRRTPTELAQWVPKVVAKLQKLPELRDVASDQASGSLEADLVVDRNTASRLGITPQMIDDTLYDAFGQRQVSTIFTQLNQYHVVLEADPKLQLTPDALQHIYVHASPGGGGAASTGGTGTPAVGAAAASQTTASRTRRVSATSSTPGTTLACSRTLRHARADHPAQQLRAHRNEADAGRHQPPRPVPGGDDLVQPRAGRVARRRHEADRRSRGADSGCRRASTPSSRAPPPCSAARSRTKAG